MRESGIKLDEMPLGSVTCDRILRAIGTLTDIRSHLGIAISDRDAVWAAQLEHLNRSFFTQIPTRTVEAISTDAGIVARESMCNMLMDVAVGQGLLTRNITAAEAGAMMDADIKLHPLEIQYTSLNCDLIAVDSGAEVYQQLATAVMNTAVPAVANALAGFRTSSTLRVTDIFEMSRHGENARFSQIEPTRLLWHGTNVSAGAAIISSGLRIMPTSSGRCGRGIYFANESCESITFLKIS